MPEHVVIFHPSLANHYAELLRPLFPDLGFAVASDLASAAGLMATADILLAHISFPGKLLSDAPRLGWIQTMGAGVDRIAPFVPARIRVSRLTGSFGQRMSEYAIGYVLAITQRVPEVLHNQSRRRWEPLELGVARGRTLGVAGIGSVGVGVARLGASIGMKITACSTKRPVSLPIDEWFPTDQFRSFFGSADFVVLTLPLTTATRQIVNRDTLKAMRPGAWLLNMSRGDLVNETDLLAGLHRGTPAGAVLDVFATEPLPTDHPFWEMSNVIITPHHSGAAIPTELVELFGENLMRYMRGVPLRDEVDLQRGY